MALAVAGESAASETKTYGYDVLGRLVSVGVSGGASNGVSVSTAFDPAGNRTNYAVATPTPSPTPTPTPTPTNSPPVANPDNAGSMGKCTAKTVNVTANDTDPNGDALTVISASATGDMAASVISASSVQIDSGTTAGAKTISYTISDGHGGSASSTISVTVSGGVCN
jgi:hypothetical protein